MDEQNNKKTDRRTGCSAQWRAALQRNLQTKVPFTHTTTSYDNVRRRRVCEWALQRNYMHKRTVEVHILGALDTASHIVKDLGVC